MGNSRTILGLVVLVAFTGACRAPAAPTGGPPVRVLMLSTTAGFRHSSIPTAQQVMASLADSSGTFAVTTSEDLSAITASNLASYDVLFFALTTGELALDDQQKAAVVRFVTEGGGFMGAHSATDTLYTWPAYGQIVGAYFKEHPWTQSATVRVEEQSHPTTFGLGAAFTIREEFYAFQENPRPNVQVLLSLDAASVGAAGDYPIAWVHDVGAGRVYYNALGHFSETWQDARFQHQLAAAVQWTGEPHRRARLATKLPLLARAAAAWVPISEGTR